jgi:hypothetical protein
MAERLVPLLATQVTRVRFPVPDRPTYRVEKVALFCSRAVGGIRTPLLASVRKENESGFDVLYLDIYFVLPHGRESDTHKEHSALC